MEQPRKILVIDDMPRNSKLLDDLLTVKGYSVETAASGAEGLEKLQSWEPDLILLDIMMPEMNGYEVCRKIRENPETGILPVVMVTSLDGSEERVKGLEAGADDFLSKPVNQPALLARVRSLSGSRSFTTPCRRRRRSSRHGMPTLNSVSRSR